MSDDLKIGSLVWAKMKGFSPWPGVITQPKGNSRKKSGQHWVFFFGTKNYAWIDDANIALYLNAKDKLINSCKSSSFKEAVSEIESFIDQTKENPDFTIDDFLGDVDKNKTFDRIKDSDKKQPTPKRKKENTPRRSSGSSPTKTSSKRAKIVDDDDDDEETPPIRPITNHVATKNYEEILNRPLVDRPLNGSFIAQRSPSLDINNISEQQRQKQIEPSTKRFGFIGLGVMGSGIVKNLINSGHRVNIWNRTTRKAEDIKEQADKNVPGQVEVYNVPCDVVSNSDIIFCCVADVNAIKGIVYSSCGILYSQDDAGFEGKGYVELSTIDIETSKDISSAITTKRGRYLEAQMQGSKDEADNGSLIILGAGDKTLFDDCQSCFQAIGKTAFYLGGVGYGIKMNSVLQTVRGISLAGLTEGLVLAERSGIALKDVMEILSITTISSPTLLEKANIIVNSDFRNPRMPLQHMQKDLRYALDLSDLCQQPMVLTAAANEAFKHARRLGYDKHDSAAVYMRARH